MLDSSEKPRMDGGAMQAIPMWSLSLGPARLCAPSCEHLFLPSQWWSEPLKQTDCGSNGMSHGKLDSHIGNRKCPTQICFKRPWICMTIIVHVGICLLSLWNGGKISKQPKAFWSSFYLNISWNLDAHQKHQENCVMHQSLPTALQMLDHFLVRKPFGNYIKCISNATSLSGQPFRTKIWLTNCGLISGDLMRSPSFMRSLSGLRFWKNPLLQIAMWNNLRSSIFTPYNSPKHLTTTATKWKKWVFVCVFKKWRS